VGGVGVGRVAVYGSWDPVHIQKILPQGAPTPPTPGEAIPRIFENNTFVYFARNLISVVTPFPSALDLAIFSVYEFWDPSRLHRNAL